MERKTKIIAEEGKQELFISREFDLPVTLLFKAHSDPGLFEQWMTHEYGIVKVIKMECRRHGSWEFYTSDAQGTILFRANGVIHDVVPDQKITRTFEMENTPFPVQLEFLEFEKRGEDSSKLTMHIVFRSQEHRDQLVKLPFAQGLDMAHNRLQKLLGKQNQLP